MEIVDWMEQERKDKVKALKVGDTVNILPENGYCLDPQTATIQSFHTVNGWKEHHGWVWLEVKEQGQLLFWPSEYEAIEEITS